MDVSQKRCSKCNEIKAILCFPSRRGSKDGRDYRCRDCHRLSAKLSSMKYPERRKKYRQEYYIKNKHHENEKNRRTREKHREQWSVEISKRGLNKCLICGYDKSMVALDFHHIDPTTKDYRIAHLTNLACTSERLKELDKCVVLCANCHRIEHWQKKGKSVGRLRDILDKNEKGY
jgi:hypothetical protein